MVGNQFGGGGRNGNVLRLRERCKREVDRSRSANLQLHIVDRHLGKGWRAGVNHIGSGAEGRELEVAFAVRLHLVNLVRRGAGGIDHRTLNWCACSVGDMTTHCAALGERDRTREKQQKEKRSSKETFLARHRGTLPRPPAATSRSAG